MAGRVFARSVERGDPWMVFPVGQGIFEVGIGSLNGGIKMLMFPSLDWVVTS
jgi:hypothetical protein